MESRPGNGKHDQAKDTDLAKVIAAQFDARYTWEEIAALCGGLKNNRFCAIWRGEKHASVVIDPDGRWACDHGRIGTRYRRKLDKYEVWCLARGIDKTRDLAERIAAYRKEQTAMTNSALETREELPLEPIPTPGSEMQIEENSRLTWDTYFPPKNERGLPIYCSRCGSFATWYGAGVTPYCDEHWQKGKQDE